MCLLYIASLMVIFLKGVAHAQSPLCEPGEYLIDGVCCPMCDSGNRVQRFCTTTTSGATSCIPCMPGTYMDHPSGLTECFKCKTCDAGSGLRVKSVCTYTKNTVCTCMDGHYCLKSATEDCDFCEKHTVCGPGEKVKVPGTERTDTICEKCPTGSFSNQSMSYSCFTWTSCRDRGRKEKERGTPWKDVECGETIRTRVATVAPFVVTIPVVIIMIFYVIKKERNNKEVICQDLVCSLQGLHGSDGNSPRSLNITSAKNCTSLAREISKEQGEITGIVYEVFRGSSRAVCVPPEQKQERVTINNTNNKQDEKATPGNVKPIQETHGPEAACDTPASVHSQSTTAASGDQL